MTLRRIGIREFRDGATKLLASGDVLAIERHGKLTGYFVPVIPPDDGEGIALAVDRLQSEARPDPLRELHDRRDEILEVCSRYGAISVKVFGSVARGEARTDSDIDLLVEFEPGRSLFDLGGLIGDLEQILGRTVDVVTPASLKPRIRESVFADASDL